MPYISITAAGKRYYIETEKGNATAFELKKTSDKGLIEMLRENEKQVVAALFLSDCDSRKHELIAADLGVPMKIIRSWKYDLLQEREMQSEKFAALKKVYGIDEIIKS